MKQEPRTTGVELDGKYVFSFSDKCWNVLKLNHTLANNHITFSYNVQIAGMWVFLVFL